MGVLLIDGGRRLEGRVAVQGAKNSVLPILAATILTRGCCVIGHCPRLRDVETTIRILRHLGCEARWVGEDLEVDTAAMTGCAVPDELMREMRSSVIFLGAILGRCGRAEISYPGGCDALWCHRERHGSLQSTALNIDERHDPVTGRAFLHGGGK